MSLNRRGGQAVEIHGALRLEPALAAARALPHSLHAWINQVETWFNIITQRAIRRGTFRSVPDLVAKIDRFVQHYNDRCHPFVWTAAADSILRRSRFCKAVLRTRR